MNPHDPLLDEFPDDERSVRALAEAFRTHADTFEPVPLTDFTGTFAGTFTGSAPARRHGPWRALAAAAAVAVIAGATTYAVTRGGESPPPAPTRQSDGVTPATGWHWESTRDLAVQVPDSWGYAPVPGGGSFCRPGGQKPFVDQYPTTPIERGIDCFGERITQISPEGIAESHWSTHLVLGPKPTADTDFQADGTYTQGEWTKVVRTIGAGQITLLYDTSHAVEARKVLATAQQFTTTDPTGCDVSSPIQSRTWTPPEPVDLAGLTAIDGMTVCQYDTNAAATTPGLIASFRIGSDRARDIVRAIEQAPVAPPVEDSCVSAPASEALVLRVFAADGAHDIHVGYRYCQGGFDDGRTVHAISAEDCSGLFDGRVLWSGGLEEQTRMCAP
jgi:hypothetical protein